MTARTVCPAVYAGLIGGALVATPTSAYALNLKNMTQTSLTGNPLTDGVLWVGAGIAVGATVGLCFHAGKAVYQHQIEKREAEQMSIAGYESTAKSQYKPRHMKQVSVASHASDHQTSQHVAKHTSNDVTLEQLADNYVKKEQYKKKKNVRSQGVAYVLAQRLGLTTENMMDGIPIIERADGTVGDVGTTWWEEAVEDKQVSDEGITEFFHINDNWSATSMLDNPEAEVGPAEHKQVAQAKPPVQRVEPIVELELGEDGLPVANVIVDKPVFEGEIQKSQSIFDEVHKEIQIEDTVLEGIAKEDIWKMALEAMDENIANDVVSHKIELEEQQAFDVENPIEFEDVIGLEDSLDDPDGLEPKTDFIPFKAPVGHPEVVDTDSYIDYLIRSEQERFNARRVKTKSRKHLRVIEGGTSQFNVIDESYLGRAKEA